ncbi:hypothetical protein BP6252_08391 [Coleophoma cylindrospora]|uniref:Uncharacterized protein n=1 Tax=Coleophoma cylindrospora TaxID=1849047 RepID=A0A3D8R604_9HELO|nr:hypothetical protein BP6252_08391 [Coleophoma cylindrospora]
MARDRAVTQSSPDFGPSSNDVATPVANQDPEVTMESTKKRARSATKAAELTNVDEDSMPSKKVRSNGRDPAPTCRADFLDTDQMIIDMKKDGYTWADIAEAYNKKTGKNVSVDYARKRIPKLLAVSQSWNVETVKTLLKKKIAIDANVAFEKIKAKAQYDVKVQALERNKWVKIASALHEASGGGEEFSSHAVEKKFNDLVNAGHVDEKGSYIGPEDATSPDFGLSSVAEFVAAGSSAAGPSGSGPSAVGTSGSEPFAAGPSRAESSRAGSSRTGSSRPGSSRVGSSRARSSRAGGADLASADSGGSSSSSSRTRSGVVTNRDLPTRSSTVAPPAMASEWTVNYAPVSRAVSPGYEADAEGEAPSPGGAKEEDDIMTDL